MKKKGFTLIEIMIVLAIIGVITAMTMGFGGNSIQKLRHQSAKALFVNTFEQLRSSALTSSFHNKKSFELFSIQLNKHRNDLVYSYHFDTAYFEEYQERIDPDISIENIRMHEAGFDEENDDILSLAILNIKPYELACDFSFDNKNNREALGGTLSFELHIKNSNKKYCFIVPSASCKIIETKCDDDLAGHIFISNSNDEN